MNKERIQHLINCLERLPDERFDYGNYFLIPKSDDSNLKQLSHFLDEIKDLDEPPCGTIGCVAGHVCMIWWNESKSLFLECFSPSSVAQEILDIDEDVKFDLFLRYSGLANKTDAINRLKYLLEHGSFNNYDWSAESHSLCNL